MENTKLEMLSTMVTSALAKIIDENSTSTSLSEIWAKSSFDDIANIGFENIYHKLHESILQSITHQYLRDLNGNGVLGNFLDEHNLTNILKLPSENTSSLLNSIYETCFDELSQFLSDKGYVAMDNIEADDVPDNVKDDIVSDWFDNAYADDVIDMCSGSLDDDLRDHYTDGYREDCIQECIDKLEDLK